MDYEEVAADLQTLVDKEAKVLAQTAGSTDFTSTYLDLDAIDTALDGMATAYPDRVQRFNLSAPTYEGRSIWVVKVTTDLTGSSNKKAIWIECGTHAREFIAISVCLGTINNLASLYNGQGDLAAEATEMLDLYDWYIIPVHNPDGYTYAFNQERFWRKNRNQVKGKCRGVDLNRNWDIDWTGRGSSPSTCSDTYRGPSALSEPETSSLAEVVGTTPSAAYLSVHSYGQYLLLPWGYTEVPPDDYDTLLGVANSAATALESVYGTHYTVGNSAQLLYLVSGSSDDYMKAVKNIKYTYTYELRPGGNQGYGGFDLPTSQIAPTITETFVSFWKLAQQINVNEGL